MHWPPMCGSESTTCALISSRPSSNTWNRPTGPAPMITASVWIGSAPTWSASGVSVRFSGGRECVDIGAIWIGWAIRCAASMRRGGRSSVKAVRGPLFRHAGMAGANLLRCTEKKLLTLRTLACALSARWANA